MTTAVRHKLPVIAVVLDNGAWGAEKAYQQAAAEAANGEDKSAGGNNGAGNENVVDAEFEEVDDNKK